MNVFKPKNHTPSKLERRNTQKQIQKNKRDEQIKNARFFGGARGAAKIVVIPCLLEYAHIQSVVSLCPDIDVFHTIQELNSSVDAETPISNDICTVQ